MLGLIGGSLAAVGALSDVSAAATGTQQLLKPQSKPKTTASLLDVASGVTGLATLTPLAPVAAPMSVVLGLTGGAMRTRIQRDERLERDAAIMAGDIQPVQPDPYQTTITKPTKRRMGRQAAKRRQEAY
mgnify:CR=1 FL=1